MLKRTKFQFMYPPEYVSYLCGSLFAILYPVIWCFACTDIDRICVLQVCSDRGRWNWPSFNHVQHTLHCHIPAVPSIFMFLIHYSLLAILYLVIWSFAQTWVELVCFKCAVIMYDETFTCTAHITLHIPAVPYSWSCMYEIAIISDID